jgi:hypothetical protein
MCCKGTTRSGPVNNWNKYYGMRSCDSGNYRKRIIRRYLEGGEACNLVYLEYATNRALYLASSLGETPSFLLKPHLQRFRARLKKSYASVEPSGVHTL